MIKKKMRVLRKNSMDEKQFSGSVSSVFYQTTGKTAAFHRNVCGMRKRICENTEQSEILL